MTKYHNILRELILLAGIGQLALAVGSVAIPKILHWKSELSALQSPLTRQIFWVYSIYIWAFNVIFGLISALAPELLLQANPLAMLVAGTIFIYWLGRILVQFLYFDRGQVSEKFIFKLMETALVLLFLYLVMTYGALTYFHWVSV